MSCRSNGSIELDIQYPPSTSAITKSASSPDVVLYLPHRITTASRPKQEPSFGIEAISRATNLPVVTINYRLDSTHRFPTPVHNALEGYDWVVKNIIPDKQASNADNALLRGHANLHDDGHGSSIGHNSQRTIALLGDGIGGSLALSLGLTECRTGSFLEYPARVASVMTRNAICDWPRLSLPLSSMSSSLGKAKSLKNALSITNMDSQQDELEQLLKLRRTLFVGDRMTDCFDPFASPLLFFRTPNVDIGWFQKNQGTPTAQEVFPTVNEVGDLDGVWAGSEFADEFGNADLDFRASDLQPLSAPTEGSPSPPEGSKLKVTNSLASSQSTPPSSNSNDKDEGPAPRKLRVYHRNHPPTSMGPARLPSMLLTCSTATSLLGQQNEEMSRLVRKAMVKLLARGASTKLIDDIVDGSVTDAQHDQDLERIKAQVDALVKCEETSANETLERRIVSWIDGLS